MENAGWQMLIGSGGLIGIVYLIFKIGRIFGKIDECFKSIDKRFDSIVAEIKEVKKDIVQIYDKISTIQTQIGKLEAKEEEHFRSELKLYMRKDKDPSL